VTFPSSFPKRWRARSPTQAPPFPPVQNVFLGAPSIHTLTHWARTTCHCREIVPKILPWDFVRPGVWQNGRVNMMVSQPGMELRWQARRDTALGHPLPRRSVRTDKKWARSAAPAQSGAAASLCPRAPDHPGHNFLLSLPRFSIAYGWLSTRNMSKRTFFSQQCYL
jgi:hypothetical protein